MLERVCAKQQRYVTVRDEDRKGKEKKQYPVLCVAGRPLGEVSLNKVTKEKIDTCWHRCTSKTSIALCNLLPILTIAKTLLRYHNRINFAV